MSNTSLALINNPLELNKLCGFDNKAKPTIPLLKIHSGDDDEGRAAPKGTFTYDTGDSVMFANEVTIRTYCKAFQYALFDSKNPTNNDRSIIANSFREEFRSTSGRIACGKMNKKSFLQLGDGASPQQKYFQDNVKCKLLIFGVVSGEFIDVELKNKQALEDALFVWTVSQSGYMTMDQAITGIEKEHRAVMLTPIHLKLKKEKQGSVIYFTPIPTVLSTTSELDVKRDDEYLTKIRDFIKSTNEYVNNKYNEATASKAQNNNFAKTAHVVEGKAKAVDPLDFDDSIPF